MDVDFYISKFSKLRTIVILLTISIVCFQLWGCSNQTVFNSKTENQPPTTNSESNKPANKDFSNKPVNLNNPKEKKKFDKLVDQLSRNHKLWKEQNISNYNFYCEAFAGGMTVYNPVEIKVRESETFSVQEIIQSQYHYKFGYEDFSSVEKMFNFIQQQMESGSNVKVEYNAKYGYSQEISVQYGGAFIHDYNIIKISKFEAVK